MKQEYFCEVCNDLRDDDECDVCGLPTRAATDAERNASGTKVAPPPLPKNIQRPQHATPSQGATPLQQAAPPHRASPGPQTSPPPSPPRSSSGAIELAERSESALDQDAEAAVAPGRTFQRAQKQIGEFLDQGFEIFLIAGVAGSGKTELLEAYKAGKTLKEVQRRDGRAIPTSPDDLECHPFPAEGRKILFLDASGEHFKLLYRDSSKGEAITVDDLRFVELFAHRLTGLTLLINLREQWAPGAQDQIRVFRNLLSVLRFLVGGGSYESSARDLQSQIDAQMPHVPRLRLPVQLLLSKADELSGLPLPKRPDDVWLQQGDVPERMLFPRGDDPLLLVHHYLPGMLRVLEEHAHTFRVDFAHSLLLDPDSGAVAAHQGCGIELSRQWLVDNSARSWRSRWSPEIPTRYWLRAQRTIDRLLRRDRWQSLPPSVSFGSGGRR